MKRSYPTRLLLSALLLLLILPPAVSAEKEDNILVWRLKAGKAVDQKDIDSFAGVIDVEVERYSGKKVLSETDIRTAIKTEEARQQTGKREEAYISDVGKAVGVPLAISGELGRVGDTWVFSLRLINVQEIKIVNRINRRVKGRLSNLLDLVPGAVAELFGKEPQGRANVAATEKKCLPGIKFGGKNYDEKNIGQLLGLGSEKNNPAAKEVVIVSALYLNETSVLCQLFHKGELSTGEYVDKRAQLLGKFASLVSFAQARPAGEVGRREIPIYKESLAALKPNAQTQAVSAQMKVFSGGRELKSGEPLNSGDGFRVTVDVPQRSYVYLLLIDSSKTLSRLYPSALTGSDNPIQGRIEIPAGGSQEFYLDDKAGKEQFLLFVTDKRSQAIEDMLNEVEKGGEKSTPVAVAVLTRGIGVRKSLSSAAKHIPKQNKQVKVVQANQTVSSYGQAAMEFIIDHR